MQGPARGERLQESFAHLDPPYRILAYWHDSEVDAGRPESIEAFGRGLSLCGAQAGSVDEPECWYCHAYIVIERIFNCSIVRVLRAYHHPEHVAHAWSESHYHED